MWFIRACLTLSCVFFGIALAAPIFSVTPGAGEFTAWLRLIKPDLMGKITQTLPGGIRLLWESGDIALSCLLAAFCVLLPVLKNIVLWAEALHLDVARTVGGRLLAASAPYAMVEVFVLAILVLAIKGLPGNTSIVLHPGAWFFTASVILGFISAQMLKSLQPRMR